MLLHLSSVPFPQVEGALSRDSLSNLSKCVSSAVCSASPDACRGAIVKLVQDAQSGVGQQQRLSLLSLGEVARAQDIAVEGLQDLPSSTLLPLIHSECSFRLLGEVP